MKFKIKYHDLDFKLQPKISYKSVYRESKFNISLLEYDNNWQVSLNSTVLATGQKLEKTLDSFIKEIKTKEELISKSIAKCNESISAYKELLALSNSNVQTQILNTQLQLLSNKLKESTAIQSQYKGILESCH